MARDARVRIALDIDVSKGDVELVSAVLFEHREELIHYATAVLLGTDDRTKNEFDFKAVAGNSHVHDPDPDNYGRCNECVRYSARARLAVVDSYDG